MSSVYFIRGGDFIKIGIARDVASRLTALSTGSPYRLEVIATIPGGRDLERSLHEELAQFRVNLEWFADCLEVQAAMHRAVRELNGTLTPLGPPARSHAECAIPAPREHKPWENLDFEVFDSLIKTIGDVSERFSRLVDSPAAQDARRVRELERSVGISYDDLMRRLYRCSEPAERYAASIKLVRRCLDKFGKISDRATLDSVSGDMSRAGPLCHAATILIERAEQALSDLQHVPGALALAQAKGRRR